MSVVVDPSAREAFAPRELTAAYEHFEERGPQHPSAENGIKAAAYRYGERRLLVDEESETGAVLLINAPSLWRESPHKGWRRTVRERQRGGGGSRNASGRSPNLHTPAKNPPSGLRHGHTRLVVGQSAGSGVGERHRGGRVRRCGWSLAGAFLSFFEPIDDQKQRQSINEKVGKLGASPWFSRSAAAPQSGLDIQPRGMTMRNDG